MGCIRCRAWIWFERSRRADYPPPDNSSRSGKVLFLIPGQMSNLEFPGAEIVDSPPNWTVESSPGAGHDGREFASSRGSIGKRIMWEETPRMDSQTKIPQFVKSRE
jgi:hypothetical protein